MKKNRSLERTTKEEIKKRMKAENALREKKSEKEQGVSKAKKPRQIDFVPRRIQKIPTTFKRWENFTAILEYFSVIK